MSQVAGAGSGASTQTQRGAGGGSSINSLNQLDMDHFLKLMITQLQNQDPMNPMDNEQMLQQISSIRSIGATDKMTSTLDAVLLGQNVSSATNLIGKRVEAMNDAGDKVSGTVDKVTIIDGAPRLHIGAETVKLSNVSEIVAGGSGDDDGAGDSSGEDSSAAA